MSRLTLSPRVVVDSQRRVIVELSRNRRIAFIVIFSAIALIGAIPVFTAQEPGFRMFIGAGVLFMVIGMFVGLTWTNSARMGRVQLDSRAPSLRFAASPGMFALFPVLAVSALLPALVVVGFSWAGLPSTMGDGLVRWGPFAIAILALAWLAQLVWSFRLTPGLTLSVDGLSGVRGGSHLAFDWDDISTITAVSDRGAKLAITTASGSAVIIEPRWLGSDPNEVAAIASYFLQHPEQRSLLGDPLAAIAHVEKIAAG